MNKQEYLENKVKPIIENLIYQIVIEKPDEPASFMIDWFEKTCGYNPNNDLLPKEREELNRLRNEVKELQSKKK